MKETGGEAMPFCPNCGTEVSEDTQFCPECGRPLAIGQAVKGKSKKKLAGIIAACIIAIIVIVVIATHPPTSIEPAPAIPTHFTTYTEELGLFSISYPSEWELALGYMEGIEQATQNIISSIASDRPVEETSLLFMAGLPTTIGSTTISFNPNVNINVAPLPGIMWRHDEVVTAEIEGLKAILSDYQQFSRVKTTIDIDNRTATIIEFQGDITGLGTRHDVVMIFLVNKTVWIVMCTALPDEYSEWEDDFDAIVRSLRILK